MRELEQEAVFVLQRALKSKGIKIHSLIHRIKEFSSCLEKSRRIKFIKPVQDMQDMVGLRVVCLFLSDIQTVIEAIHESFEFLREADSIHNSNVSTFGYMSHHLVVQMKTVYKGPRYDTIAKKPFEIQVRTILMDAWANVSHHLNYKTDTDVPKNLLRDFHALSGLFYVADTHFEMFFRSSEKSQQQMSELFKTTDPEKIEEEINLDSLSAYFKRKFPERLPPESPELVSRLVSELKSVGYRTIAQIDGVYERVKEVLYEHEKHLVKQQRERLKANLDERPKRPISDKFFTSLGLIRVSFLIADENYCRQQVNRWEIDDSGKERQMRRYAEYRKKLKEKT